MITFGFLALTLPTLLVSIYFVNFQTYVLQAEIVTGYASIACQVLELLLGAFAAIEFKATESNS